MALSITSTYAGEAAGKFISAALLSADTIEKGAVEIMPNVKYKQVVNTLSSTGLVQDASCDFTDAGSLTLAERIIEPKELQVNLQLCKSDFLNTWQALEMGFSAHDEIPASFAEYLIAHVAAKVAEATELSIWGGDDTNAGEFDGFTTLMAADASVVDVVGTTIDATNVIAELGKVVDAIPSAVYGKEDLAIYVPANVARAYTRALGAESYNNGSYVGEKPMDFDGVKMILVNGMPSNKMVAAQKSNLFFATGLLSDHNEVRVVDLADIDGSQNIRFVMRYTAAVQYGIGSDIVLYA